MESKKLAMSEAQHVLGLMKELDLKQLNGKSSELYDIDSELFSQFNSIGSLISTLESIGDDESKEIIVELEKQKQSYFSYRNSKGLKEVVLPFVNNDSLKLVETNDNDDLKDIGALQSEELFQENENHGTIKDDFCTSIFVAVFICMIIAIGWGYFFRD